MHASIAALEMATRRLGLSGNLDQSQYSRIIAQLHQVSDELIAIERRVGNQKADPVNFAELLRGAVVMASLEANSIRMQVSEDVMVEGPADDLRDLVYSLVEYARTVGQNPIELRGQGLDTIYQSTAACSAELIIQSPDVPDFLRRMLWNTVRIRQGEVSITSELDRCRVKITLPIERRSAAHA
jgi:hypothetical protein